MKKRKQTQRRSFLLAFVMALTVLAVPAAVSRPVQASSYAKKVLDNWVGIGTSKTVSQYDLTGNGKADTLKISATSKGVKVYVNGKKAYEKKAEIFEDIRFCLYKQQKGGMLLAVRPDWYSEQFATLLRYKSGKYVQKVNLYGAMGIGEIDSLKISSKKIVVPYVESRGIGNATFDYTYTLKKGKWVISKYGTNPDISKDSTKLTVLKKFTAYKDVNSKSKAFTPKVGSEVQVKKCRVYKGKFYVQLSYKGKTGWIKDPGTTAGWFNAVIAG